MSGGTPEVPEHRKVRPHRMIVTGRVLWPAKGFVSTGPPPLVHVKGRWHIAYVFQLPLELAANRDTVIRLRAGSDQRVCSLTRGPVESWHLVNAGLVESYKCGAKLQSNEVALLVSCSWWLTNLLKGFKVPCSAFFIDRAQFGSR